MPLYNIYIMNEYLLSTSFVAGTMLESRNVETR